MRIQFLGCVALALLGVGCEQPDNECRTPNFSFAARFTRTTADDDACRLVGEPYRGDLVGVQTYNRPQEGDPQKIDLDRSYIAIKAFQLQGIYHNEFAAPAGVGDPDVEERNPGPETRRLYAVGDFTGPDPVDDICTVPTFSGRAQYLSQELPATPCEGVGGGGGAGGAGGAGGGDAAGGAGGGCEPIPGVPGLDITYDWNNFRLIERSDAPGTVFTAQMSYSETRVAEGDTVSCTASYDVIAIAPAIDCAAYDADGHPTGPDPVLCDPVADPDAGRVAGSGLNPKLRDLIECIQVGDFGALAYQCALKPVPMETIRETLENTETGTE